MTIYPGHLPSDDIKWPADPAIDLMGTAAWADAMADMRAAGEAGDTMSPDDVRDFHALCFPSGPAGDAAFAAYVKAAESREVPAREVHATRPPFQPARPSLPAHQAATYWGDPVPFSDRFPLTSAPYGAGVPLNSPDALYPSRADLQIADNARARRFPDYEGNGVWKRTVTTDVPSEPYHYAMHHGHAWPALAAPRERVAGPMTRAVSGLGIDPARIEDDRYIPGSLPCDAPVVALAGFPPVDSAPPVRQGPVRRARALADTGLPFRARGRHARPGTWSRLLCRLGWLTSARAGVPPRCGR